jgi:glycosyltransferase involved in cell wall biosynthesis
MLLIEALESAFAQTRPPDEIIVVDDGSTDNTAEVMARYNGKVRYVRQENSRAAAARNHGIRVATGEFIALLDSDDLWVKDRLERQLTALAQHPGLDLIFGLEAKFTAETEFSDCEIKERDVLETLNNADCVVPDPFGLLLKENFIPTSTVLFRKSCIDAVGWMDSAVVPAEDYDYWVRFALHGFQFGFINAVHSRRRMHSGNLVREWALLAGSTAEVLSRYRDHSAESRQSVSMRLSGLHYDLGSHLLAKREFGPALNHLRKASPSGRTRLVWAAKLAVARLLCH